VKYDYVIGNPLIGFRTGVTGLTTGFAALPKSNQQPLVVRSMIGRLPGELGVSKSVECDTFSLQCSDTVGWMTGRASGL